MIEILEWILCAVVATIIAIPLTLLANKIIEKYNLQGKGFKLKSFSIKIVKREKKEK